MFSIEMLPAYEGDALWIEYGDPASPHRVLIDGGYKKTYRLIRERLKADPAIRFDLVILTHIDADHIGGAIPLIADALLTPGRVDDIWFNGYEHLSDVMGVAQGEHFSRVLEKRGLPWNLAFDGGAVVADAARVVSLQGGMRLTVLSPTRTQLRALRQQWADELEAIMRLSPAASVDEHFATLPSRMQPDVMGDIDVRLLTRRPFEADTKAPNGSSIAVLAEYTDAGVEKRALLTGDAFAPVLVDGLDTLLGLRQIGRLKLGALKVSHHGSRKNTSPELLERLSTERYLVSTNGSRHEHPDDECIARLVSAQRSRVELCFNYETDFNRHWAKRTLQRKHNYVARYPDKPGFLKVDL